MSQRQLAAKAGLSNTVVMRLESGDRPNPGAETIQRLETALGEPRVRLVAPVSPDELIDRALDSYMRSDIRGGLPAPGNAETGALRGLLALLIERMLSPFTLLRMHMMVRSQVKPGGRLPSRFKANLDDYIKVLPDLLTGGRRKRRAGSKGLS